MSVSNHSAANILHKWLLLEGLVGNIETSENWPGFVNFMPDAPDNLVVLTDTGGTLDGRGHRSKKTYKHPAVQVRVRGGVAFEQEAFNLCERISQAFDSLVRKEVVIDDDSLYLVKSVSHTSTVTALGRGPESDRPSFVVNVLVDFEKAVG